MRSIQEQATEVLLCRAYVGIGYMCLLVGLGMFGWEGLLWLRDGTWTGPNLADAVAWVSAPGFPRPDFWDGMRGVQKIAQQVGTVGLESFLSLLGMFIAWRGTAALETAEREMEHLKRLAPAASRIP